MSRFRAGRFDRGAAPKPLRPLCPSEAAMTLSEVDLQALWDAGKRLVMIDVDNTLLPWGTEEIPPETTSWLDRGRAIGMQFCLLSNTRHPARLDRLCERLGVRRVAGKLKPSRQMYLAALEEFGMRPEQAVMVGDQLFTDVLGANRSGVEAIWVRPSAKREFVGTKVHRMGEWLIQNRLFKAIAEEEDDLPIVSPTGIFQSKLVRQFAKFCIVGGSSFAIDASIRYILMFFVTWDGQLASVRLGRWMIERMPALFAYAEKPTDASVVVAVVLSASVAILNSFIWNRRWTFGIKGSHERVQQLRRFVIVSVIGMLLNTTITTLMNSIIPGHPKRSLLIATMVATVVVAVWNFSGQRLWAFRKVEG